MSLKNTNSITDYVQMKKQRTLAKTDNYLPTRASSSLTRNKRFHTALSTEIIDEDGFTVESNMYGVNTAPTGTCDISLATCDTQLQNNTPTSMFALSRLPQSRYQKNIPYKIPRNLQNHPRFQNQQKCCQKNIQNPL